MSTPDANDPFAAISEMRGNAPKPATTTPTRSAPSKSQTHTTADAPADARTFDPTTTPVKPVREEAPPRSHGRDILVGTYIDEATDAAITAFERAPIAGSRRRASRSAVTNWLIQLGLATTREQGLTSVPASVVATKRRKS